MLPRFPRAVALALLLVATTACASHPRSPSAPTLPRSGATGAQPLATLTGKRVLAILVPEQDPRVAYFVAGQGQWTGTALQVVADGGTTVTLPVGQGFAPSQLPKLIIPEHLARVQDVARGADAVVAIFTTLAPPRGALRLELAFHGLARAANGEALLMVGEP